MQSNKVIIGYCKNFYRIVNFEPLEEDTITNKLIKFYQEYIFRVDPTNAEDIVLIKKLDEAVGKYIDDYAFRDEFKKQIVHIQIKKDVKDILKEFIRSIIKIFNNYEEFTTRRIYISKWI